MRTIPLFMTALAMAAGVQAAWWNPMSWGNEPTIDKTAEKYIEQKKARRAYRKEREVKIAGITPPNPNIGSEPVYNYINYQLDNADAYDYRLNWVMMGPTASVAMDQSQAASGAIRGAGAGRVNVILPVSSTGTYLGLLNGGVWYTTGSSTTNPSWTARNQFMASTTVTALANEPGNISVIYAGTGAGNQWIREGNAAGIQTSTNSGQSWTMPEFFKHPKTIGSWTGYISGINAVVAVKLPTGTSRVIAGFGSRLADNVPGGILTSTDRGVNWSISPISSVRYKQVNDIQVVPGSSGATLLAVASTNVNETAILRSTDYGATWSELTKIGEVLNNPKIGVTAANPSIVYVVGDQASSASYALYKSTQGGNGFTRTWTGSFSFHQSYCTTIWVDPLDPSTVILGNTGLKRSINGGTTFADIVEAGYPTSKYHPDVRSIASVFGYSSTNRAIWVGTDGGVWKVSGVNNGATPTATFASTGINALLVNEIDVNSKGEVVAGAQDNGSWLYRNGVWSMLPGFCDGGGNTFTPNGQGLWYSCNSSAEPYKTAPWVTPGSSFAGVGQDLYSGVGRMAMSAAGNITMGGFNSFSSPQVRVYNPTTNGYSDLAVPFPPYTVELNPKTQHAWYSGGAGKIGYLPIDQAAAGGNPAFTDLSAKAGSHAGGWVASAIRFHPYKAGNPFDWEVVYAAYQLHSTPIWKSEDYGQNWEPVSGLDRGTGNLSVTSLALHPEDPDMLMAGTKSGMIISFDGGKFWGAYSKAKNGWIIGNEAPANVEIRDMQFNGDTLYVGSYGRGVFKAKVPVYPRVF